MPRYKLCQFCRVGLRNGQCPECGFTSEPHNDAENVPTSNAEDNRTIFRSSTSSSRRISAEISENSQYFNDSDSDEDEDDSAHPEAQPLKKLYEIFDIKQNLIKKIPSRNDRTKGLNIDSHGWSKMILLLAKCVESIAKWIYPHESQALLQKTMLYLAKNYDSSRTNCACYSKIFETLKPALESFTKVEDTPSITLKRKTLEYRVCKAICVKILPTRILQSAPKLLLTSNSTQAYADFASLASGQTLPKKIITRGFLFTELIESCVDFILSGENIGTLSWGKRVIRLSSDEVVEMPLLIRRMDAKSLFDKYMVQCNIHKENTLRLLTERYPTWKGKERRHALSRRTFYAILNQITGSGERLIADIDYTSVALITEPIARLQAMIEHFSDGLETRNQLTVRLSLARNVLKYTSRDHMSHVDSASHDFIFALSYPVEVFKFNSCSRCNFVNFVVNEIRDLVKNSSSTTKEQQDIKEDALQVLDDSEHKFELFRGYRIRQLQQQMAISEVYEQMRSECLQRKQSSSQALLITDFKMKFQPSSSRESSVEFYGKRGISWMGCLIAYYRYVCRDPTVPVYDAELVRLYIDQIVECDNEQDTDACVSGVEAALHTLHEQIPHIKTVVIQSDNAACYTSKKYLAMLQILNTKLPIKITRILRAETQDGKTALDAHFSIAMSHVKKFMRTSSPNIIKAIATGRGLAYSLSWNGGIQNSIVMLIQHNRKKLDAISEIIKPALTSMGNLIGRCSDICLEDTSTSTSSKIISLQELQKCKKCSLCDQCKKGKICTESLNFSFCARFYSGVGEGVRFTYNLNSTMSRVGTEFGVSEDFEQCPTFTREENESEEQDDSITDDDKHRQSDFIYENQYNKNMTLMRGAIVNEESDDLEEEGEDTEKQNNIEEDDTSNANEELHDRYYTGASTIDIPFGDIDISMLSYDEVTSDDTIAPDAKTYEKGDDHGGKNMFTGVRVMRLSKFGNIRGPRDAMVKYHNVNQENRLKRRDIVANAVRYASSRVNSDDGILIHDANDLDLSQFDAAEYNIDTTRQQGWARPSKRGQQYGKSYIDKYASDIAALFKKGKEDSSKKSSPQLMQLYLEKKYPNKFSLPGDIEIKQEINKLLAKSKGELSKNIVPFALNEDDDEDEDFEAELQRHVDTGDSKGRNKMPQDVLSIFRVYLENNPQLEPKSTVREFLKEYPKWDYICEKKLCSYFSRVKSMISKRNIRLEIEKHL